MKSSIALALSLALLAGTASAQNTVAISGATSSSTSTAVEVDGAFETNAITEGSTTALAYNDIPTNMALATAGSASNAFAATPEAESIRYAARMTFHLPPSLSLSRAPSSIALTLMAG